MLGRERVFYDERYQAELPGLDGDLKLRRYYREQSELVVPFFSEHYRKDLLVGRRKPQSLSQSVARFSLTSATAGPPAIGFARPTL